MEGQSKVGRLNSECCRRENMPAGVNYKAELFPSSHVISTFVAACGLSLVAMSRGYSLAAVQGLLILVASLIAEHGF